MKKILASLIVATIFLLGTIGHRTLAEDFDFNRAYNDYTYTYSQYRQSLTDFQKAKQAYLSYKTEASKQEVISKTVSLLYGRSQVLRTYLTAIRRRMVDITGINDYRSNVLFVKLDDEVTWLQSFTAEAVRADSLEKIAEVSEKSEARYLASESLIYESLAKIITAKIADWQKRIEENIVKLETKLNEIPSTENEKQKLAKNFLTDARNRLKASKDESAGSQAIYNGLKNNQKDRAKIFEQGREQAKNAIAPLKEAIEFTQKAIAEMAYEQ